MRCSTCGQKYPGVKRKSVRPATSTQVNIPNIRPSLVRRSPLRKTPGVTPKVYPTPPVAQPTEES